MHPLDRAICAARSAFASGSAGGALAALEQVQRCALKAGAHWVNDLDPLIDALDTAARLVREAEQSFLGLVSDEE
jgi:hypothetical protein